MTANETVRRRVRKAFSLTMLVSLSGLRIVFRLQALLESPEAERRRVVFADERDVGRSGILSSSPTAQ